MTVPGSRKDLAHGTDHGDSLEPSAFASIVRHDLVNPLSALHGWLHLLAVRPAPADEVVQCALAGAHRALDQQQRQIEQLAALIELSAPDAAPDAESAGVSALLSALAEDMPVWLIGERPQVTVDGASTESVVGPPALLASLLRAVAEFVHRQGEPGASCWLDVVPGSAGVSFRFQVAPVREPVQPWPGLSQAADDLTEPMRATVASLFAKRLLARLGGRLEPLPSDREHAFGLALWLPMMPAAAR